MGTERGFDSNPRKTILGIAKPTHKSGIGLVCSKDEKDEKDRRMMLLVAEPNLKLEGQIAREIA